MTHVSRMPRFDNHGVRPCGYHGAIHAERKPGIGASATGRAGYHAIQARTHREWELDGRSELYAVGIVLWEFLSHRRFPASRRATSRRCCGPSRGRSGPELMQARIRAPASRIQIELGMYDENWRAV